MVDKSKAQSTYQVRVCDQKIRVQSMYVTTRHMCTAIFHLIRMLMGQCVLGCTYALDSGQNTLCHYLHVHTVHIDVDNLSNV